MCLLLWASRCASVVWCGVLVAAGIPEQDHGWCSGFNYTDGTPGTLVTRQRPKWITDPNTGRVTHLTTGVNRPGDSGMGHVWTMAAKLV